jgi:hypothetical protein
MVLFRKGKFFKWIKNKRVNPVIYKDEREGINTKSD